MDLIPYSDSDSNSDCDADESQSDRHAVHHDLQSITDHEEIIEVTQKPFMSNHLNFNAKSLNNQSNISLDFGTSNAQSKSLFHSLPIPSLNTSSHTSLHQSHSSQSNHKKAKRKKKKKSKKQKESKPSDALNPPKRKKPTSLIDILPKPSNKRRKLSPPASPNTVVTSIANAEDKPEINDLRSKQREEQRQYKNPMATFSITEATNTDHSRSETDEAHKEKANDIQPKPKPIESIHNEYTASSIYKVDENRNYLMSEFHDTNAAPMEERVVECEAPNDIFIGKERCRKGEDESEIITICQSTDLLKSDKHGKQWMPSFEIDDITKEQIKNIPTNTYNPETGKVEKVRKYTKTQRKKHQINTLAIEAQEKALQLAMRKSSSYKTKAETQAKYGW